jgi:hypothetical protein
MASRPSAAVLARTATTPKKVDPTTLEKLRERAAHVRSLDQEIADIEERLGQKEEEKNRIIKKELPDMMSRLGMPSFELEASGNDPAYRVRAMPYYHANIDVAWEEEKRARAFKLLADKGAPDMLKTMVYIELGRGTTALLKKIQLALKKLNVEYSVKRGVPYPTLTAWLREIYENNGTLTAEEKEALGATVGTVVSIKPVKETKRTRAARNVKETY